MAPREGDGKSRVEIGRWMTTDGEPKGHGCAPATRVGHDTVQGKRWMDEGIETRGRGSERWGFGGEMQKKRCKDATPAQNVREQEGGRGDGYNGS